MYKHMVGGTVFHNTISSLNFILVLLLTVLYQLTKPEATSCNGFQNLPLFQVFYVQICKGH